MKALTFQLKKKVGQNQGDSTAAFLLSNKFLDQKSI
jgi:hypothetical protein